MNMPQGTTRLDYIGPNMLETGDLLVLRGFDTPLPYVGRAKESEVLIRIGSSAETWIRSADIEKVLRPPKPLPNQPGLYQSDTGYVFLLDSSNHWWLLRHDDSYVDGPAWADAPLSGNTGMIRRNMPLTPIATDTKPVDES